jgi:hypothetical protein
MSQATAADSLLLHPFGYFLFSADPCWNLLNKLLIDIFTPLRQIAAS